MGRYASSKFSFKGIAGVFSEPTIFIGASKYSKQFSWIIPAKPSEKLAEEGSSVTISDLPCFLTDSKIWSSSKGDNDLRSKISIFPGNDFEASKDQ